MRITDDEPDKWAEEKKRKKMAARKKPKKKKTNQKNLLNEEDESSPAPHDENRRPISTLFFFLSSSFLFCFFFGFFFIVEPSVGVDFEEKKILIGSSHLVRPSLFFVSTLVWFFIIGNFVEIVAETSFEKKNRFIWFSTSGLTIHRNETAVTTPIQVR